MISRRTPKVFFSSYRPSQPAAQRNGQLRQLVVVAAIIVGGYFLTRLPLFQIRNITVAGTDSREIIAQLEELKGQSILSSATAVTLEKIKEGTSEVLEIRCDKGIPDTLRCTVVLRQPIFTWLSGGKKYLVDGQGVAYVEVKTDLGQLIEDRKNVAVVPGDRVMSEELVRIFSSIGEELSKHEISISRFFVELSPLHPGVVADKRSGKKPFPAKPVDIFFSSSYPVKIQAQLLKQLLDKKSGSISRYVDLRTPGYIYYR